MKLRTGFVSNSSSSSFCILGIDVGRKFDFNKLEEFEDQGLDFHEGYGYYDVVLGVRVGSLDKDKTINQLRAEIAQKITQVTGEATTAEDVDFCTDGGYDG